MKQITRTQLWDLIVMFDFAKGGAEDGSTEGVDWPKQQTWQALIRRGLIEGERSRDEWGRWRGKACLTEAGKRLLTEQERLGLYPFKPQTETKPERRRRPWDEDEGGPAASGMS